MDVRPGNTPPPLSPVYSLDMVGVAKGHKRSGSFFSDHFRMNSVRTLVLLSDGRGLGRGLPTAPASNSRQLATRNQKLETNFRAPGEQQTLAAGLYSGAMLMPPPYRPAAAPVLNPAPSPAECGANGGASGFGAEIFLNRAIFASRRGVPLKMRNFVQVLSNFAPQGIHPGYSAPSPIVPAGKHYTTSTVLSSGEALKK